ncbi:respiratory chain complex I subunit 1 family protein [Azospirillum sp. B506]|uniref:respiratory chain complex I subunit 1 family protein n=1 Tax=Azospirillum sp. B506 TaxID=137721 RepID=UPI0003481ED0|nr:complex I subunit 1 family protein [Azospirillum sp. B506]
MSAVWSYLVAIAVWPGLLFAAPLGWLELWFMRKLVARLQGRQGPPFFQPFFDVMKLLGKETVIPKGVNRGIFLALPLVSLAAVTAALAIVPLPGNPVPSLPGDIVLLLYLMEVPVLCEVLAGYVSRSIYGQVAAMREAILSLAYNLPFLVAIIAMAQVAGSFQMRALQEVPYGPVHLLAALTFLLALPARMKLNPFSIANAEHEIIADSHIEYSGPPLALFKLSHAIEVVLLTELFAVVFIPATPWPPVNLVVYLVAGILVLGGVTLLATATARLRLTQAFRFYWIWGGIASAITMAATLVR